MLFVCCFFAAVAAYVVDYICVRVVRTMYINDKKMLYNNNKNRGRKWLPLMNMRQKKFYFSYT